MRRDDERLIEVIIIAALKTISAVLEAESRTHEIEDKHPVEHAKKHPDAIDVEYRVIDDGRQE